MLIGMQNSHCTAAFTGTSVKYGLDDGRIWLESRLEFLCLPSQFLSLESQTDPSTSSRLVTSEIRPQHICHCILIKSVGGEKSAENKIPFRHSNQPGLTQRTGTRSEAQTFSPSILGFLSKLSMEFLRELCKSSHLYKNLCTPPVHQEKVTLALSHLMGVFCLV